MTQHIVSFSGGKDSTAMLLMMIEKGVKIDRVVCVDTTKEFPGMYDHIEQVQKMIYPIEIEIVTIDFDYWFGEHIKTKGSLKGYKGYGWPDMRNRWCTALKQDSYGRVVSSMPYNKRKRGGINCIPDNIIEYHGIAFDEKERQHKNNNRNIKYPLIDWQITEKQALQYCYDKGLTWNGLYEDFSRVSCFCCPLSSLKELRVVFNKYPEIWDQIKEMNKKSFRKFRSDYSIEELEVKFINENKQLLLF